jgi:hypothetical protein
MPGERRREMNEMNELGMGREEAKIDRWCEKVLTRGLKASGGVHVDHVARKIPEDLGDYLYKNLLARL